MCCHTGLCRHLPHPFRHSLFSFRNWAYLLPVAGLHRGRFLPGRVPLPFLLYPLLVLVLLRLGLGWAALATLFVAAVEARSRCTGRARSPPQVPLSHLESAVIPAALYRCLPCSSLYSVSVVIETLRSTERRLQEIASLHKLVTENSRDVIIIADFEGRQKLRLGSRRSLGRMEPVKRCWIVHRLDAGSS